jgi:hypothetical protein
MDLLEGEPGCGKTSAPIQPSTREKRRRRAATGEKTRETELPLLSAFLLLLLLLLVDARSGVGGVVRDSRDECRTGPRRVEVA